MRFLLDVSALLALGVSEHEFHGRVAAWIQDLTRTRTLNLATCSITELGFVRILAQTSRYRITVPQARDFLLKIKGRHPGVFTFIADSHDISRLPGWVKYPKQITDGHLLKLAAANGCVLATLDTGIPGAFLIPV